MEEPLAAKRMTASQVSRALMYIKFYYIATTSKLNPNDRKIKQVVPFAIHYSMKKAKKIPSVKFQKGKTKLKKTHKMYIMSYNIPATSKLNPNGQEIKVVVPFLLHYGIKKIKKNPFEKFQDVKPRLEQT